MKKNKIVKGLVKLGFELLKVEGLCGAAGCRIIYTFVHLKTGVNSIDISTKEGSKQQKKIHKYLKKLNYIKNI